MNFAAKMEKLPSKYVVKQNKMIENLEKKGHSVIRLGRGNPDQPTFPEIIQEAREKILDSSNYGYPPYGGKKSLKKAIQSFYLTSYGIDLLENQVAITNGSALGLSSLAQILLDPEDLVLLPEPSFFGYEAAITLANGKIYRIPLSAEQDYLIDYSQIPESVLQKAKLLFLNYPNNPTGAVATKIFFENTVAVAKKYHIIVVHDFAYSSIYYTESPPISFLSIEGAFDVGVETFTLSKAFNMAGWRSGFVVGNEEIIAKLNIYLQNAASGVFGVVQDATVFALETQFSETKKLNELYEKRLEVVLTALTELNWEYYTPKGTFFVWTKYPDRRSSQAMSEYILEQAHVAVLPGSAFGKSGEGWLRISLVNDEQELKEAFQRIKNIQ